MAEITIRISGWIGRIFWKKDVEMLAESGCNVVSLGIFAWSTLEPEDGRVPSGLDGRGD